MAMVAEEKKQNHRDSNKRYYLKNRDRLLVTNTAKRQRKKESVIRWRKAHPEEYAAMKRRDAATLRAKNIIIKTEVMTHYGNGKCACVKCGEARLTCLSIDHINGGGRREYKNHKRSSYTYYKWLKEQGYPSNLQTLCMNCQWVKRFENNEFNYPR